MSESVKIAEDLQAMYEESKLGTIMFAVGSQIRDLIERLSAAEAALALAKEELSEVEEFLPPESAGYPTISARAKLLKDQLGSAQEIISALQSELARLKAPVSDAEMEEVGWSTDDEIFKESFDLIIAARSKAPDGAQEAEGK